MSLEQSQTAADSGAHRSVLLRGLFGVWFMLILLSFLQDMPFWPFAHRMLLDVDSERSFYTWFSHLLLGGVSLALFNIAGGVTAGSKLYKLHWLALSAVFLFLSLDEAISMHERVGQALGSQWQTSGHLYFAWVIPALAICGTGLAAAVPFLKSLPRDVAAQFLAAAGIFVCGAVGAEMIGGTFASVNSNYAQHLPYRLTANIEEALEGLGALIFLSVLLKNQGRLQEGPDHPFKTWRRRHTAQDIVQFSERPPA